MRVLALATSVLVAPALAGCGGDQAPRPTPGPSPGPTASDKATATPRPPTDAQQLEALIGRRGNALDGGRPRALAAATVPRRRARARAAGRRARRLGLTSARYVVQRVKVHGLRARLRVRLSYRVRGIVGDFGSPRTLRARRLRGGWRITGAVGTRSEDPWALDDYGRRRSPHFVIWTPRDIPAPVAALEAGYARLREVLHRGRLRRRYLVVVARDGAHTRRLTERIAGLESITALTDTHVRLYGPAQYVAEIASQRLIVNQAKFALAGFDARRTVITHELTHAALAPITSGRVPGWLAEGVALYVSGDDRRQEAARDRSIGTAPPLSALSAPDAVGRLDGDAQAAAYATASAAGYAIADRYGRDGLLQLYEAFGSERLKGRRGDPRTTDRATRRVLGLSLGELQRRLR